MKYYIKVIYLTLFTIFSTFTQANNVNIGIFTYQNTEYAKKSWQPTIDYISEKAPDWIIQTHYFQPNEATKLKLSVANRNIDFIITQPTSVVELQIEHAATPLLTIVDSSNSAQFGSVIFTLKSSKINNIKDIQNIKLGGSYPLGLGGWLIGIEEIKQQAGIDPRETNDLKFLGVQENIVSAVLSQKIDVGIIRTGILEHLSDENKIDLSAFKFINSKSTSDFPYILSTKLYPEWALLKATHTPNTWSKELSMILLAMPKDSNVAKSRGYSEWITTVDYQPVHQLMKNLQVGIYNQFGKVSLLQYIQTNPVKSYFMLFLSLSMLASLFWSLKLNRKLKLAKYCIEEQHQLVLNSVTEGIFGVNHHGYCMFANRSMQEILGWKREEIIGKKIYPLIHRDKFIGPDTQSIVQDVFLKRNGDKIVVEYSIAPVENPKKESIGNVIVFKDITQQLKQQKAEKEQKQEIEHLSRLNTISEMVTGISHELNQPLTSITTRAFALTKIINKPQFDINLVTSNLEAIGQQANFSAKIIQQLRKMAQKKAINFELIDINKHIEYLTLLLKPEIESNKIDLELKLNKINKLKAQPTQIDQVLLNLLRNSIDALQQQEAPRKILVSTNTDNEYVTISVIDNGPGITKDIKEKLFEPFITSKAKGLGLGLSISQSIMENHCGHLCLEKTKANHTEFKMIIPLTNGETLGS